MVTVKNHSISILILLYNQVRHPYNGHIIFIGILKTEMPLTVQENLFFRSWKS